jgi:glycosyltransferase involved in cell wall biosynthesis
VLLEPVGKKRLIDYYRSCDVVLDHFVYGYYGATALEAAAIGKPVVMKLRADHYAPLYRGDVAPVEQAGTPEEVQTALLGLVDSADRRAERGREMRNWLVRNHGEQKTAPVMLALLQLAADKVRLPRGLDNPLTDPLSADERAYHERCRQP